MGIPWAETLCLSPQRWQPEPPLACPQGTDSPLLAHPLWSQVTLPLIITEHFILDAVNADRELTVPLAAASSEGAQGRLPGHVL